MQNKTARRKKKQKTNKLEDKIGAKTSRRHIIQYPGRTLKKALKITNNTLLKKIQNQTAHHKGKIKKNKLGDKLGEKTN